MSIPNELITLSKQTESILGPPFEWCHIPNGTVNLLDASDYEGTAGGAYQVADFAIGKYLITNAQYEIFISHPNGFRDLQWWNYSPQAIQWRKDHPNPKPTA